MTEKIKCKYCSSEDTLIFQNEKSKSIDENPCGITTCNTCNHITFWILKFKNNYKVSSDSIDYTCNPKLRTMKVWFGPITPWLYDRMTESCEKTGQDIYEMISNEVSNLYGTRIGATNPIRPVITKYTVDGEIK